MISLRTPNGEPSDYYLSITGPQLSRYEGPLNTVVDLGAHVGAFTILAAKEFGAKFILAVEADPVNFSYLVANIGENGLSGKVLPVMACVDVKPFQVRKLYRAGSSGQRSTTFDSTRFPSIDVLTLNLQALYHMIPHGPVDFLKVDIEGSEWGLLEALTSIGAPMRRTKYVDIEFHPTSDPKYHAEIKEEQLDMGLNAFRKLGFNLIAGEDRWNYHGYTT